MKTICYFFLFMYFASPIFPQSWQKMTAPMPGGAKDACISFTIGDKFYVGGGNAQKTFYEYDPSSSKWTKKADIPGVTVNRGFGIGFSINGKGYASLGTDGAMLLNDLWEYDPLQNTWSQKANYPGGKRDGLNVFVIDNKAYAAGGTDNKYIYPAFYEYDPAKDAWTQKQNLPTGANGFPTMFTIGSYGYLACGEGGGGDLQDVWRYDATKDSWEQMASFPGDGREEAIGFVLGGKAYVGLGQSNYDSSYTDMYSYDPAKDQWTQETAFPGKGRAWVTAGVVGGQALIGNGANLTGAGGFSYLSDWWSFGPSNASINKEHQQNSIQIFPQPALSSIRFFGTDDSYEVTVFDMLGRKILAEKISGINTKINVQNLPAGIYTAQLSGGEKNISLKFVKAD